MVRQAPRELDQTDSRDHRILSSLSEAWVGRRAGGASCFDLFGISKWPQRPLSRRFAIATFLLRIERKARPNLVRLFDI